MEDVISSTVLWTWMVGCGIWAWNQHRQSHWDHRQLSLRPSRPIRRGLFGVLLAALSVLLLDWWGLSTRSWLLPIPALDQPIINQTGLLLIRMGVCWVVIATVHRERFYRSWQQQRALSPDWLRYWEPYYHQQLVLAGSGLLLGLFLALSGGITGGLCLTGWWFSWRLWRLTILP